MSYKKTILVTGVTGLLGSSVVKHLAGKGCRTIVSVRVSQVEQYRSLYGEDVISNEDIFEGRLPHIDAVINCAFARSNNAEKLAQAIDFTEQLIGGFVQSAVGGVINVSSQGVYKRLPVGQLSKEDSPIEPIDLYSMTKYAVEKTFRVSGIPHVTNVRLASVNMKQRFLYRFVQSVKEEGKIFVNSPNVYASLIDEEDAAEALAKLSLADPRDWKPVYNLSIGQQYSLAQYAETVKTVGERFGYKAEIITEDNGNTGTSGSDNSLLKADIAWKPVITNEMMVEKMFK